MRRKRGILIVAVLLSTVLVAMFIGAAISLSPFSLARGDKDQDWRLARAAAASGVEYALGRLQADPSWRGAGPFNSATDPDFSVSESKGNVVGILRTGTGRFSQFRIRFNWENGSPAQDPDQMGDSGNPMDFDQPSLSNVDRPTDYVIPASAPRPAITVPGRAIYIVVQGRAGKACEVLSSSNLDPFLTGSWGLTQVTLRTIYKINNPGQLVDPAVGMSGGNFIMDMGDSLDKYVKIAGANGQPAKLRSKQGLKATGGDTSFNLQATGQGQYRLPAGVTPTATGLKNISRGSDENPGDAYYNMTWADVRKADGTNTLKAGTYVWMDDGSLHYFDMSPKDYIAYATANPADTGLQVYQQADGVAPLGTGLTVTSSGSGSAMKATLEVHADTAVTAATNTTELAILPRKGAAEQPPSTGSGTPSDFQTWMLANAFTPLGGSSQYQLNTNVYMTGFYAAVALWGSTHGYGTYGGGNWNLGSISMQIGIGSNNVNLPSGQWSRLQDAVNAYLGSGDVTVASTVAALTTNVAALPSGGNSNQVVPGSTDQVDPKNLKLEFKPQGSSSSAVLSSDGSITIGASLKGKGASIVSKNDVNLVGLGLDLAANPNATEGVSLFAGRNILISTYDANANKFNDVSLKGVIYANGDVRTELGHPSLHADKWGKFKLNGSMIAYGGDPVTQTPGQAGAGNIDMMTRESEMDFDPAYLTNLMATLPTNLRYGCWLWVLE